MIKPSQKIFEEIAIEINGKKGRFLKKYYTQPLISIVENFDKLYFDPRFIALIKKDKKTALSVLKSSGLDLPFDIAIKCFNYRSIVHYLIRKLAGSRARHFYRINLKLLERGLSIPELIGFFESDKVRKSYCMYRFIGQAENLGMLCKKGLFNEPEKIARELSRTIADWHLSGAVHGDLKWSNILLQNHDGTFRFYLIDLDQTRLYQKPSLAGLTRDLTRFYSYGLEVNAEQWVNTEFLRHYEVLLPEEIRTEVNFGAIKERAHADWKRKGRRTPPDA